jgi:hypothetical protein
MHVPKQSRPVMRGVSHDPIEAEVKGSAPVPFGVCVNRCAIQCGHLSGARLAACEEDCLSGCFGGL